ncbi:hypothetical protein LTSEADE_3762, partial [Salmonella enterica subsp. enterica serovar Adelaide str. A4-669]
MFIKDSFMLTVKPKDVPKRSSRLSLIIVRGKA